MECSCAIEMYHCGNDLEIYSETYPVAKKGHKCSECHQTIKPGEEYERFSGKWGGEWKTYKTCQDCLSLRKQFFPNGFFFEMIKEDIEDFINDARGEIPELCISQLTPNARNFVCDLVEKAWE